MTNKGNNTMEKNVGLLLKDCVSFEDLALRKQLSIEYLVKVC